MRGGSRNRACVEAICLLIVAFLLLPAGDARAEREGRTYLVPDEEADTLPILIDGKVRTYYAFGIDDPVTVAVPGPTTLTLLIRLVFAPPMPDTAAYGVELREGSTVVKTHWTVTKRGDDAFVPASPNVPGRSRKLSIEIPEGSHNLTLTLLGDVARQAAVRFSIPGEYKEEEYASIAPLDFRETVTALAQEKQITYYLLGPERALNIRLVGPTRLRILSRLAFDQDLRGKRRYGLHIEEGGRLVREDALLTTRSTSVVFTDRRDLVPGKDKVSLIEVPKGVHRYAIRLGAGSEAPLAAVRFTIPERDLGNSADDAR